MSGYDSGWKIPHCLDFSGGLFSWSLLRSKEIESVFGWQVIAGLDGSGGREGNFTLTCIRDFQTLHKGCKMHFKLRGRSQVHRKSWTL